MMYRATLRTMRIRRTSTWAIALTMLAAFGCAEDPPNLEGTVVLGTLLPYTGKSAGLGVNIESSLIMVRDEVNDAGGLLGRPMGIDAHDTHADLNRGTREAEVLLERENLFGVMGPENPDLAVQIARMVGNRGVVNILPGDAAPRINDPGDLGLWFRTGPAAPAVASAMVQKMRADDIERLLILFEPDAYGAELNRLLACEFMAAGGVWARSSPIVGSISNIVADLTFSSHDAVALITYPKTGAQIVVEQTIVGGRPATWYLSPALDSPEFTQNVLPSSLDRATGVSPALESLHDDFSEAYLKRWDGRPLTTASYYFDAAAIWALAVEAAGQASDGDPTAAEIAAQFEMVSSPPGEMVEWDTLAAGLEMVRNGMDIDYFGLTGALDIGENGEARQNWLRFWTAPEGTIEYDEAEDYTATLSPQCL